MKLTATGVIHNGRIAIDSRAHYEADVARFGEGESIVLTVETYEEHRSNKQNAFLWGPVIRAFMTLGYGKQEAHDMLALQFLPHDVRMPDGTTARIPGHTSTLTRKAFTDFLEECLGLAASLGLVVEDVDAWRENK